MESENNSHQTTSSSCSPPISNYESSLRRLIQILKHKSSDNLQQLEDLWESVNFAHTANNNTNNSSSINTKEKQSLVNNNSKTTSVKRTQSPTHSLSSLSPSPRSSPDGQNDETSSSNNDDILQSTSVKNNVLIKKLRSNTTTETITPINKIKIPQNKSPELLSSKPNTKQIVNNESNNKKITSTDSDSSTSSSSSFSTVAASAQKEIKKPPTKDTDFKKGKPLKRRAPSTDTAEPLSNDKKQSTATSKVAKIETIQHNDTNIDETTKNKTTKKEIDKKMNDESSDFVVNMLEYSCFICK
jgi:hypothetical protein